MTRHARMGLSRVVMAEAWAFMAPKASSLFLSLSLALPLSLSLSPSRPRGFPAVRVDTQGSSLPPFLSSSSSAAAAALISKSMLLRRPLPWPPSNAKKRPSLSFRVFFGQGRHEQS